MKSVVHILGPSDAGPGERQEMLRRAAGVFEQLEATDVARLDVSGTSDGDGLRTDLQSLIPALQSGSLFGDRQGVLLVDGQGLTASEGATIAELLELSDLSAIAFVVVSSGALPQALTKAVKKAGETIRVSKMRERDAANWLGHEIRARKMSVASDAATALLQRFGSDVAALAGALDQLQTLEHPIRAVDVIERFRNRPDEPMWHFTDAVVKGDRGEALRRLEDFLTHGHPLQLLGYLANDLRRRALLNAADNVADYAESVGTTPDNRRVQAEWRRRGRVSDSDLTRALDALSRTDRILKTSPEETHRVTLERLTVALCTWYAA